MKRDLSLIIVPHDEAKARNFKISYRLLYFAAVLAAASIIVLIVFMANYGKLAVKAYSASKLENQNKELLFQVLQIDSLKQEIVQLQAMSIQIKRMLGVGLTPGDSVLVAELSATVKSPAIAPEENPTETEKKEQRLAFKSAPSLWPVKGFVTREFRTTGGEKSSDYHPGIDIAAALNTAIVASADGVVVTSMWDETYGNIVVIDHGLGIYTLYGHNLRNLVAAGDRVAKGQTIAFVGSSGKSTAPHLHFEVKKHGLPVNPREYLLD